MGGMSLPTSIGVAGFFVLCERMNHMRRSLLIMLALILGIAVLGVSPSSAAPQTWQLLDGPVGASVAALAMSPNFANDHTVFAGIRGRGVYRTIDGGETWQPVGLSDQVIGDLAISPNYAADHTIFAAAGLAPSGFNVYRSTDGGATWQPPLITPYAYGFKPLLGLSISPDYANDHTLYVLNGTETYKTSDGGLVFSKASGWFASHTITSLALSPGIATDHIIFAAVQNDQLYKSADGGAHWNPAGLGGDILALALSPTYSSDHTLAVVIRDPNAVGSVGHLRVSYNDGAAWNDNTPWPLDYPGQARLMFSPSFSSDHLLLAGSSGQPGLTRSTDGGQTWAVIDQPGLANKSIFALALAPASASNPYAFLGTSSGFYRSFNRGDSWYPDNAGLPRLTIRRIALAPGDADRMLAATSFFQEQRVTGSLVPVESDSNLQLSSDGGQTWRDVSGRIDQVQAVAFSPDVVHDQIALACTGIIDQSGSKHGGIYRSTDAGVSWGMVYAGYQCTSMALSPDFAHDRTAWASFSAGPLDTGIFQSVDGGASWTRISAAIVAELIVPSPNYAIDHTLYAATTDQRVMRSTDGGAQWWPDMNQAVTALTISPAFGASETLYAYAPQVGGLLRKIVVDELWYGINSTIPATLNGQSVHFVFLDFAADGSVIAGVTYGSANAAVYRSVDGGATWQLNGSGLEQVNLFDFASTANTREGPQHGNLTFYAATSGGLWRLDQFQRDPTEPGVWDRGGPRGGRADALALSPDFANDGIVLTGEVNWIRLIDYGRGLFKSSDGGETWKPVGVSGMQPPASGGEAVHGYAFSPGFATDKTVYAATSRGLYQSSDRGDTWRWLPDATWDVPGSVTRIMLSPDYPTSGHLFNSNLYGCLSLSQDYGQTWKQCVAPSSAFGVQYSPDFAHDNTIFATGFNVYLSTDRGLTWSTILTGTTSLDLSPNYAVDHSAFTVGAGISRTLDNGLHWTSILSASVANLIFSPQYHSDQTLFARGAGNIAYRSTNNGATWISSTIGLSTATIGSIALSPVFASDHLAYAGGDDGLYRSTNGGIDWSLVPEFDHQPIASIRYAPDWPTHPYLFVSTAQAIYRSSDGGATWSPIPDLAHVPLNSFQFAPGWPDPMYVFAGSTQGVLRSTDGGSTWTRLPGFTTLAANALALSADDAVWIAGTSNGLYASTNYAGSWQPYGSPRSYIYQIAVSPAYASDHTTFIEGSYGGMGSTLLRTIDGGVTWTSVRSINYNTGLALSPQFTTDHTLFVLDSGVWRSVDGGDNWSQVGTWPGGYPTPYRAFALPPNYPADATLFVAGPGFWLLPPGESMWQTATSGISTTMELSDIAVAPDYATSHTILAAGVEYPIGGMSSTLLRSDDGGRNWVLSDIGLPNAEWRKLAFSPHYADDHTVYLISAVQLYRSVDGGHTWTAIGAPPDWPELNRVAVSHSGQVIITSSTGVWRYTTGYRDILIDGDVEAGNGWELIGGAAAARDVIFSGQQALRVGLINDLNTPIDSAAIQTITIPMSATLAQLNLRIYPVSRETQSDGDAQYATLTIADTPTISRTLFWIRSNAQAWQRYSFDLRQYAGETVVLRLGALNDGLNGRTALYIDNASLVTLGAGGSHTFLPLILRDAAN